MTCNSVKKIIESRCSFDWKLERLAGVVEILVNAASEGNLRNIGVIATAIAEMNRMQGHHAAVTTLNLNVDEDEYMRRLREVTMQLIEDKKASKLLDLKEISDVKL